MAKGTGTRVFWVQTGGFDTHASQDTNTDTGAYVKLMVTLNDGLTAFYNDLKNQGLLNQSLLLSFSEFGRRISENGSRGTDHGSASVMMAMGGSVHGGLFGTAPSLAADSQNPTLENNTQDVKFENDFRSVYARVIDNWLGGDSVAVLGGISGRADSTSSNSQVAFQVSLFSFESAWRASSSLSCERSHAVRASCSAASARRAAAAA
jgi:uncharacterized protein (DUF1501 family)